MYLRFTHVNNMRCNYYNSYSISAFIKQRNIMNGNTQSCIYYPIHAQTHEHTRHGHPHAHTQCVMHNYRNQNSSIQFNLSYSHDKWKHNHIYSHIHVYLCRVLYFERCRIWRMCRYCLPHTALPCMRFNNEASMKTQYVPVKFQRDEHDQTQHCVVS